MLNLGGESYIKVGDGNKLVKKEELNTSDNIKLSSKVESSKPKIIKIGENFYKEKGKKLTKLGIEKEGASLDNSLKKKRKKRKERMLYPNKSLNKTDKSNLTIEGIPYFKKGKSLIIKKKNLTKTFSTKR